MKVGIDFGFKGCFAFAFEGRLPELVDMLVIETEIFGERTKRYNEPLIFDLIKRKAREAQMAGELDLIAYVEHQRAYGFGDNAKTLSTLCYGYGVICMALIANGFTVYRYEPKEWKQELLGSKNASKHESVEYAQDQYPELRKQLIVSKDGRSDALNILRYGELITARKLCLA